MFVINFDFSSYDLVPKLLAINIPILISELITYPLQRIQMQLIKRDPYITRSQLTEVPLILSELFKIEGFPKYLFGLRYTLDYSMTQMTFKFLLFDHLMFTRWASENKYAVYLSCIAANAFGTLASQSAFNYQTIGSSLDIDRKSKNESVTKRMIKLTENKKVFRNGIKYTLPVSIINSVIEVFMILKLQGKFLKDPPQSENELKPVDFGFTQEELIIASLFHQNGLIFILIL